MSDCNRRPSLGELLQCLLNLALGAGIERLLDVSIKNQLGRMYAQR